MAIYLSLGSNLGDRRANLRAALAALAARSVAVESISPVVESPALLPANAEPGWNLPFLNLVARCRAGHTPQSLLGCIKDIEQELGRSDARHWAPRPIDIDILTYDALIVRTRQLIIPHPAIAERPFVLTPLAALAPELKVPGINRSARELNETLDRRIPLWMGIINLTPDSFSDGGQNESWAAIEERIDTMLGSGVHILDIGAESTRPGATPLSPDQEWERLAPMLSRVVEKLGADVLRPLISVDTYHSEVAGKALAAGADMINDVGGLTDEAMLALAATTQAPFVAMHNLGLPADPDTTLDTTRSATDQVEMWLDRQLEIWQRSGIDRGRITFDPGIGFGKNPIQSLELLREIERLKGKGVRLLVGHSRKSFMRPFSGDSGDDPDLITIGGSMALCARGVDILRVHAVWEHVTAWRGWAHLQ